MKPSPGIDQPAGIVLVGTHPWTYTPFDRLPPRPLLPIAHRPLISYALSWMRDGGIRNAAVCANRETQMLESRLYRHVPTGLKVSYHEDSMPRGAAGAVRDAADGSVDTVFVVADGTAIPTVEMSDLLAAHEKQGAAVTVVCHLEAGRHGKPPLHVPSGIYVFDRRAIDVIPERGFCDIKETLISKLRQAGERVCAYVSAHPSPRVLDDSSYRAVNEWMVEHLIAAGAVPEGYVRARGCLIHRDSSIARDAALIGPVLVGPGARIGSRAVIVGPTSIGREVEIGQGAMLSRSAVWRRCVVGDRSVADRCILADDTVVAAGANVFRAVLTTMERGGPSDFERSTGNIGRDSVERWRTARRAALANAVWSRSPAAQ